MSVTDKPCDHNVIPIRIRFRARWICVRCDRVFDTPPPRADAVREEGGMTTFREAYEWMRRALEAERGLTAERAQFARIADAAEQIAKDAARDPGGYSDGAEGFRWAAEHIRQAIREAS